MRANLVEDLLRAGEIDCPVEMLAMLFQLDRLCPVVEGARHVDFVGGVGPVEGASVYKCAQVVGGCGWEKNRSGRCDATHQVKV